MKVNGKMTNEMVREQGISLMATNMLEIGKIINILDMEFILGVRECLFQRLRTCRVGSDEDGWIRMNPNESG